jgi:hypothetical protein
MKINPESIVKSRIAETIVEEMLRDAGYRVYRLGNDSFVHNLVQSGELRIRNITSDMPDLMVVKDGKSSFIEVKFRTSGKLRKSEFTTLGASRVILVMPEEPYFKISTFRAFKETGLLYDLSKDRYIKVGPEVLRRYTPLVEKYLKSK